ncbi:hypothetical protein CERSUDRAFT_82042 [Gelatoporia subvermispora B]|uniref:Carboxypeptidase n=1 Tax=Ceriporiopsis subvermispora (strain B) TaxID=914234 RepID=M2R432_CERS8|nr:hypothetical protein CERSUDRAFT_82042 [Gelatoporia subvermispora B]
MRAGITGLGRAPTASRQRVVASIAFAASLSLALHPQLVAGQATTENSWPHAYPGMPSGDYSPEWQSYFEVTERLPNVTWDLGRNWAGNVAVNREGHPNDTLFFWAFESSNGSLTAPANESNNEPWGIWLNGGPGASSLLGLLYENGPIHLRPDFSAYQNNYSWNLLADYIWIDQPLGTGWSTTETGSVRDEDQMGSDFMGFLENLVKIFPSLKTRPLHITGESYAGTYIPYITKAYFSTPNPPVNLAKIAIGDGTIGNGATFEQMPTLQIIETYPQLIGYDTDVYEWFKEQEHLCGYDLNLTYPQNGLFPTLEFVFPSDPDRAGAVFASRRTSRTSIMTRTGLVDAARKGYIRRDESFQRAHPADRRLHASFGKHEKRDLSGRTNGSIDPWYGCFLYDAMIDYALNFSFPWNESHSMNGYDVYDVPDALNPEVPLDGGFFYNNNQTRAALHAPTSKEWIGESDYMFSGTQDGSDPSSEPMTFLTELATNATAHNVSIVVYSGNDDSLIAHRGSEAVIQNTTFGGIQGFTRPPSTPWYDDEGNFAGIVHQERNWTFVLVKGAGHLVAEQQPSLAFVFLREFVLGNNDTGLLVNSTGSPSVVGGEGSPLVNDVLPGQSGIFYGSGATQSTYTYPSATIASWESFVATAITAATTAPTTMTKAQNTNNGIVMELSLLLCVIPPVLHFLAVL